MGILPMSSHGRAPVGSPSRATLRDSPLRAVQSQSSMVCQFSELYQ